MKFFSGFSGVAGGGSGGSIGGTRFEVSLWRGGVVAKHRVYFKYYLFY
jgi:hypothetical protein